MRLIDADVLKNALEMDGYKSPYVARMIDACPVEGEWLNPDIELPASADKLVLVIVNGQHQNIGFRNAIELATYSDAEGWILEHYPEWESPNVSYWMPLPELPKEICNDHQ